MSRTEDGHSNRYLTTSTKITVAFVTLGVLLWYGSMSVTDNRAIQFATLLGVGVIAPTVINELRR